MTKMRWPAPVDRPIGWSIRPISGLPKPKRKIKPRRPGQGATFAQKHRWGAEKNWGIGTKKPPNPKPRKRIGQKRRQTIDGALIDAMRHLMIARGQIANLEQKGFAETPSGLLSKWKSRAREMESLVASLNKQSRRRR